MDGYSPRQITAWTPRRARLHVTVYHLQARLSIRLGPKQLPRVEVESTYCSAALGLYLNNLVQIAMVPFQLRFERLRGMDKVTLQRRFRVPHCVDCPVHSYVYAMPSRNEIRERVALCSPSSLLAVPSEHLTLCFTHSG